jgi:hypothetical protein
MGRAAWGRRLWLFKGEDGELMATPDQIRRRGRWSLVIGTIFAGLLFAVVAYADVIAPDADLVAVGNQTSRNLGTVAPGATLTPQVTFELQCAGNQHVDNGQSVSLTFNSGGSTVPAGGSLNATNATIGPVPASWPDDANGCGSPAPSPIQDNGNSTVSITAPTAPGSYAFVPKWDLVEHESSDVTGSDPTVTFTLVVPADATPPVISPNVSGTLGNNGWHTSDVAVSWTVTEPDSAISSSSGCGSTTITSDTTGTTLTCTATSAGGTASQSVTIKRDATAPTISGSASPAPNANGWNDEDVTVSFTCSDLTSGVASCQSPQTLSTEGAGQSASGSATDSAGNGASTTVSGINIDKTAPTASASATPPANANGWNNSDVTVTFTGTDAVSDIDFCDAPVLLSTEGAGQSASGDCTDKAGNVSDPASVTGIKIDKTAPTLTWSGGPAPGSSHFFGFVPPAPTCAAVDALSGPDTCAVSGYGTTVGSHTMTATAKDKAGNTGTEQRSYTVLAWTLTGFFQPVDMNGVFNVVKNGSTVPLKFRIFAGPTELTDVAHVRSLKHGLVACDASAPNDEIETVATGGTSLRYDASGGQFIYNWKTPGTPGKCYSVTMTTQDGSTLSAFFKLK